MNKIVFRLYQFKIILFLFSLLAICTTSTVSAAHSYSMQSKFISYTDVGQGQPLVLIHAFPTDQTLWNLQVDGLKQYFRVITLDLWGFGRSGVTDGKAITMSQYADEVKELLDQLHIQKAIIGGESMGGYIALAFVKKYPENTEGLILSDTQSIADSSEVKLKREAIAVDVLNNGSSSLINGFMLKALSSRASEQTRAYLHDILITQSPAAMASALRGMALREDTSAVLAHSVLSILILTGDQDILISPQQSHDMHTLANNSKLVVIQNAGHLSNLEQPAIWNQAVVDRFYQP